MSWEPLFLAGIALFFAIIVGVIVVAFRRSSGNGKGDLEDQESEIEEDFLRLARAAHARGDYEEAIGHYKSFAATDQYNRLPWVEIAKIQHDNLEDPQMAAVTLKNALEGQEWPTNDAAYFMIRLAEIHWQDLGDTRTSASILNQVIECFPDSRHSANAVHLLREMQAPVDEESEAAAAEQGQDGEPETQGAPTAWEEDREA